MSDKPGYELARQARGEGTMTIEPKSPSQSKPVESEPHNESLDLPDKTGRTTQGGIVPNENAKPGAKLQNAPTHPGEFGRSSKYDPLSRA